MSIFNNIKILRPSKWLSDLTRHLFFDDFIGISEPDPIPRAFDPNIQNLLQYMKDNNLNGYQARYYTYNQPWVVPYLFYNHDLLHQSYTLMIVRKSANDFHITMTPDQPSAEDIFRLN